MRNNMSKARDQALASMVPLMCASRFIVQGTQKEVLVVWRVEFSCDPQGVCKRENDACVCF